MSLIYTIAQQKGGAGKTMLAANLAAAFAPSLRVALVDIDPQRSLGHWMELRGRRKPAPAGISFSDVSGWRLPAELDRLGDAHDVIIIDSPPHVETDARVAIRAASLVLVPLQPSPPDLWAAQGTLKLAAAEKRAIRLLFNRAPAASRLRLQLERDCAGQHLQVMKASLGNRVGFVSAFALGLGVTEFSPQSAAAAEIHAVIAELSR